LAKSFQLVELGLHALRKCRSLRHWGEAQPFVSKCGLGERRIDPLDLQEFALLYRRDYGFFLPPK
jgi:hypothetical protein